MPSSLGTRSRLPPRATPAPTFPCTLPDTALIILTQCHVQAKSRAGRGGQQGHLERWQCRQGHSRCCTARWQHLQHPQQRAGAAQGARWPARAAPPTCQARVSCSVFPHKELRVKTNTVQRMERRCKAIALLSFPHPAVFSLRQQHSSAKWKSFLHQLWCSF